jgi:hypothetical protein
MIKLVANLTHAGTVSLAAARDIRTVLTRPKFKIAGQARRVFQNRAII